MAQFTKDTARAAAQASAAARRKKKKQKAEDEAKKKARQKRADNNMPYGTPFNSETARAAALRSAESKRRKKSLAELVLAFAESDLEKAPKIAAQIKAMTNAVNEEELTIGAATVAAQYNAAIKGDTKAFRVIAELEEKARGKRKEKVDSFTADYGTLIAEPFLAAHRRIWNGKRGGEFWLYGGRTSTKSSAISLELVGLLMSYPELDALITVKHQTTIRDGVYRQVEWALDKLGVSELWEKTLTPLQMVNRATGQLITFRGCDRSEKSKGLTPPVGTYYGVQWFEECDQLGGMGEIRTVQQTATRHGGKGSAFWRFYSFNPPRSKDSWANKVIAQRIADGEPVYRANYNDVPPEWIDDQVRIDAERLKQEDEMAYRHEYLGEPIGFGNEVFDRVEVREQTDEEASRIQQWVYGVDWGFSQDPFCWVRAGYIPATRTLYVVDEFSGLGLSDAETAKEVAGRMQKPLEIAPMTVADSEPYATVMCDSAEPKSIANWKAEGIAARGAPKQGAYNVRNSIKWLQQRAKIVVLPRCKLAAEELSNYSYVITPSGELTAQLPDANNHAIDALRYAVSIIIADKAMT